ncbi:hypothetical protein RRG08_033220 [Elysia crispata]|uniref:Uncharacterized protein n=1 Tax=Elysia crispata TaxID=231223 RepID=A0AAE1ECK1_9GAST|nr:hypothetical protein RRG08_033220 [Elysia crispata]
MVPSSSLSLTARMLGQLIPTLNVFFWNLSHGDGSVQDSRNEKQQGSGVGWEKDALFHDAFTWPGGEHSLIRGPYRQTWASRVWEQSERALEIMCMPDGVRVLKTKIMRELFMWVQCQALRQFTRKV